MAKLKFWMIVFLLPLVSSREQNSDVISSQTSPKLRICSTASPNLRKNVTITLPAFSPAGWNYLLQNFHLDTGNPLEFCESGDKPISSESSLLLPKASFDEEVHIVHVLRFIRVANLLMTSGHLSLSLDHGNNAQYLSTNEFCLDSVQGSEDDLQVHFKYCQAASNRPVLRKCCPLGMMLFVNETVDCVGNPDAETWDPVYMDPNSHKFLSFKQVNPVITFPILDCPGETEVWQADNCDHEFHPLTDNTVAYLGPYRTWEFLNATVNWCIDSQKTKEGSKPMFFYCVQNQTEKESEQRTQAKVSLVYMGSMYVGAVFHLLTTLVYLITWGKQNIHGKTLCSLTASLFLMQVFLGTAHLLGQLRGQRGTPLCFVNSIGGQYFLIAAFTWLLVVNFDLWRTFRSMRTEGGKSKKRFIVYSILGWLFPITISAISIAMDLNFKCRNSRIPIPEFGEYYCFVAPWAQGLYVYYILGVLIAFSYGFAAFTLFGLYTFKKDTANLRSNRGAQDQQNILLFLKLSVVMGLTWIFEVISWAATRENENHWFWIILDLYNSLSAIIIFLIFVCKKTTLHMLEQTVPALTCITGALSKVASTFSAEPSSVNTASTTAPNNSHHKKSIDAQGPVVHFTKNGSPDGKETGDSQK